MFQFTLPKLTAAGDAGQNAQLKTTCTSSPSSCNTRSPTSTRRNFTEAVRQQYEGAKDVPARVAALS